MKPYCVIQHAASGRFVKLDKTFDVPVSMSDVPFIMTIEDARETLDVIKQAAADPERPDSRAMLDMLDWADEQGSSLGYSIVIVKITKLGAHS